MLTDVLYNRLALGNHNVLVRALGPDADRGRFSKRVDGFEFRARALVGVALVDGDVVGQVEFFEEPDYALAAGFVEPMCGEGGG